MVYIFNCKWVDTRWQQYSYIYTQTVHRIQRTKHTQESQNVKCEVLAVPRLCELYPSICLTTDEKARKNLSQGTIQEQLGTIQEQLGTIQEQLGTIQEQLSTIQEQLGTIHEQLGTIQEQLGTIQEQLGTIQEQLTR